MLLEQRIFSAVPAVRFGVSQMLLAVQLDYDAAFCAQKIDLHLASAVKTDR